MLVLETSRCDASRCGNPTLWQSRKSQKIQMTKFLQYCWIIVWFFSFSWRSLEFSLFCAFWCRPHGTKMRLSLAERHVCNGLNLALQNKIQLQFPDPPFVRKFFKRFHWNQQVHSRFSLSTSRGNAISLYVRAWVDGPERLSRRSREARSTVSRVDGCYLRDTKEIV